MQTSPRVAIIGITGAVGQELLDLIEAREFSHTRLRGFASERSAGRLVESAGNLKITVEALSEIVWSEHDVAFFCASGDVSRSLAPLACREGCIVIDNSSAFRQDPNVPLVLPEVNGSVLSSHRGLIANPNCSTAIALMALYPLHQSFDLISVTAATYQAVSGAGAEGIAELDSQLRAWSVGESAPASVFPYPIAFNAIPHVDTFLPDGYTREEMKMVWETRKILDLPDLKVSATCVRLPVHRAHSIALFAEFRNPVDVAKARECLAAFPGVELCDDPDNLLYPMPLRFTRRMVCGVGRLRKDLARDNGLALWVVGDQLWKGAALNALQIAERIQQDA